MSRLYKISNKYKNFLDIPSKFILAVLTKKFLREGNYLRAKNLVIKTFNIIKTKEPYNPYLIFLIALYNISPRITIISEINPLSKQIIYKKKILTKMDSIVQGIKLLVKSYIKNKGRDFSTKLANEIILSFYKKSLSYNKKMNIEREIIKKTAKVFSRRKKIKFFTIV